jgi:hypothetical protein
MQYMFLLTAFLLTPFSFAETSGTGRVNSPWTANLALRAGTARQGGLVGSANLALRAGTARQGGLVGSD